MKEYYRKQLSVEQAYNFAILELRQSFKYNYLIKLSDHVSILPDNEQTNKVFKALGSDQSLERLAMKQFVDNVMKRGLENADISKFSPESTTPTDTI